MITDEMLKVAQDTYDEYSMRAALEAVAPMILAQGMREAFGLAVDAGDLNAILARADKLDPPERIVKNER